MAPHGLESGLDRLDSVSVRIGNLVKDRRPPEAAALCAGLDKIADANNWQPSDQSPTPDREYCSPMQVEEHSWTVISVKPLGSHSPHETGLHPRQSSAGQ